MDDLIDFDASVVTFRFLVDGTMRVTFDVSPLDNVGADLLADPHLRHFHIQARRLTAPQIKDLLARISLGDPTHDRN